MAFQGIVTGFTPNDGQGDTLLAGAIKTNDNFRELYEALGDGTSIGIATLTQLKLSGILTATSLDVPDISVSGILTAANIQVSGVVTANSFSGDLNGNVVATSFNSLGSLSVGNQVRITSAGALQNIVSAATSSLTVTGQSTLVNVNAGVITATSFNGSFNGSFTGNSIGLSGSPDIEVGIVTANTGVGIGTSVTNTWLSFPTGSSVSSADIIRAGTSALDYTLYALKSDDQHVIRHVTTGNYTVSVASTNQFAVSNSAGWGLLGSVHPGGVQDSDTAFVVRPDTSTELRYNYGKKLETTGVGVTVFGTTESQQLSVSGVSTFTGAITANGGVVGDLTGDVTGNVAGNVTGNVDGIVGGNTPAAVTGTTITANTGFVGNVTGNLTGNVTGTATTATNLADGGNITTGTISNDRLPSTITKNLTGDVTGNLIGNVTGNVTGTATTATIATNAQGLTGSPNITVTDITAFGNVSIAGTLTYEDVTNVDSIGLITARNGLQVDSGGINVTGNSNITGILTASEYRFPDYGNTNYTRLTSGQLLVSGVNDKGSVQVGALTTVFSMGHAPFNNNCYFSQTGENDWVFWSGLTTTSMTVNGGISTRPHSVTLRKLYVDTNADIDGNLSVSGIATLGSHTVNGNDFKVGTTLNFKNSDGSSNILTLDQSGSVDLYHNTNKKFETTASGVEVTGGLVADNLSISGVSTVAGNVILNADLDMRDSDIIRIGNDDDLQIYHDGSDSYVEDTGTGALIMKGSTIRFRSTNNEKIINAHQNGSVDLFYDNSKKFETTGVGASVLGTLEVSSFAEIGSGLNVSGIVTATTFFGALNGTALLAEGLTGTPDITVDDITAAQINVSGLTTTTNKVEVRSTDSTPGRIDLFCEVSNAHYARLQAPFHSAFSGNVVATLPSTTGTLLLETGSGANLTNLTGAASGSYGSGSAIPVITVDANGRITGISTASNAGGGGGGGLANVVDDTSPQLGGTLNATGFNIEFGDSAGSTDDRLTFGIDNDLQIYHDSNNSFIEDTGTGFLGIRGESLIALQSLNGSENYAIFNKDGAVELYHNNSQKFRTLSTGATITGTLSATSFSGDGSNLTGIVTSLVAGSNVTLGVSGGRVTINASGGGGGGGTGINVQNNGVAIGSTTTQTINFNNDLEATVNGSVVTVNSTAPSQATAIALAIALG